MLPCVFVFRKENVGSMKKMRCSTDWLFWLLQSLFEDVFKLVLCFCHDSVPSILIQASQDGSVSFLLDDQRPREPTALTRYWSVKKWVDAQYPW